MGDPFIDQFLKPSITGQILTRPVAGRDGEDFKKNGKHLVSFVGIVAVPDDVLAHLKEGAQFVIHGVKINERLALTVELSSVLDRSAITIGNSLADCLREGIWRV